MDRLESNMAVAEEWEEDKSCLLCIHGRFINLGTYPQDVKCDIHGMVKERQACSECEHKPFPWKRDGGQNAAN